MPSVVPTPPVCVECGRVDDGARGWRGYLVGADDEGFGEPEPLVVYCPACSEREFGDTTPDSTV